jgi:hypothetical protein
MTHPEDEMSKRDLKRTSCQEVREEKAARLGGRKEPGAFRAP